MAFLCLLYIDMLFVTNRELASNFLFLFLWLLILVYLGRAAYGGPWPEVTKSLCLFRVTMGALDILGRSAYLTCGFGEFYSPQLI